jgi:hypothetical protein
VVGVTSPSAPRAACVPREYDSMVVRYSLTNPLTLSCDLPMPQLSVPPNRPVAWHIRLAFAHPWTQAILVSTLSHPVQLHPSSTGVNPQRLRAARVQLESRDRNHGEPRPAQTWWGGFPTCPDKRLRRRAGRGRRGPAPRWIKERTGAASTTPGTARSRRRRCSAPIGQQSSVRCGFPRRNDSRLRPLRRYCPSC